MSEDIPHPFGNLAPAQEAQIAAARQQAAYTPGSNVLPDRPAESPQSPGDKLAYLNSIQEPGSTAPVPEPAKRDPVASIASTFSGDADPEPFSSDIYHSTLPVSTVVDMSAQFKNAFKGRQ